VSPLEILALQQSLALPVAHDAKVKIIDHTGNFGIFHPRSINLQRLPQLPSTPVASQGVEAVNYQTRKDGTVRKIHTAPKAPPPEWQECYRTTGPAFTQFQGEEVLSSFGTSS